MESARTTRECVICGKPAFGIHYNVVACIGCKVFYKRCLRRKFSYLCFMGGNCKPNAGNTGSHCKACRFSRCHALMGRAAMANMLSGPNQLNEACLKDPSKTDKLVIKWQGEVLDSSKRQREQFDNNIELDENALKRSLANVTNGESWPAEIWSNITSDYAALPNDLGINQPDNRYREFPRADRAEETLISTRDVSQVESPFEEHDGSSMRLVPGESSEDQSALVLQPILTSVYKSLWRKMEICKCIVPLDQYFGDSPGNHRLNMINTMQAVAAAAEIVFGDQIAQWTAFRNRADAMGYIEIINTTAFLATKSMNCHHGDNIVRTLTFASLLPGMDQLDGSARLATRNPWKFVSCWLIHHSPFMIGRQSFITMGEQQMHLSLYWMEKISKLPVYGFFFKFSAIVRDIGLTQSERYLLMAIVIFEPDNDRVQEHDQQLQNLHQYYVDVLLESLRQRSTSPEDFTGTACKLEKFFECMREAGHLQHKYFDMDAGSQASNCSHVARQLVSQLQTI